MPKDHLFEVGPNLQKLRLELLRMDGSTQPRGGLDEAVVDRYAAEMTDGLWDWARSSTAITAFFDGEVYWTGDGFHRGAAAKKAGFVEVEVDVRQGGQRDAILYSVGANATHGYPRSNDDKRRAVSRLLDDPEWSKWSDREIARHCSVTHPLVSKVRASLETVTSERTYTTKHGTIATMNTSAIGKPLAPPAPQQDVETAETGRAGGDEVVGVEEAAQAADDAKPAAKPFEAGLKYHLSHDDLRSVVARPARQVAAAARLFTPKTLVKIRKRMEPQRQWLTDFLAALDEAAGH
jgi:hypothetical protein